jgi:hypothetical protein
MPNGSRRDPNVPPLFHHIGEMRSYLRLKRAPTRKPKSAADFANPSCAATGL